MWVGALRSPGKKKGLTQISIMRLLIKNSLLCYVQSVVGIVSDEDIEEIVQLHWHWWDAKKALELLSQSTDNFLVRPLSEARGFELTTLYAKEIIQQFDRLSREHSLDDLPEFCTTSVCDLPPRSVDQVRPSVLSETTLGRLLSKIDQIEGKLKSVESLQHAGVDPAVLQHLVEASVSAALAPICTEITAIVNHLNEGDGIKVDVMPSAILEKNIDPRGVAEQFERTVAFCGKSQLSDGGLSDTAGGNTQTASMSLDEGGRQPSLNKFETRGNKQTNMPLPGPQAADSVKSRTDASQFAVAARSKRILRKQRALLVAGDSNIARLRGPLSGLLGRDPRVAFMSVDRGTTRDVTDEVLRHSALRVKDTSLLVIIHVGVNDIINPWIRGDRNIEEIWFDMESGLNDLIGNLSYRAHELAVCAVPLVEGFELDCAVINSKLEAKLSGSAASFVQLTHIPKSKQNIHADGILYGTKGVQLVAKALACEAARHLDIFPRGSGEQTSIKRQSRNSGVFFRQKYPRNQKQSSYRPKPMPPPTTAPRIRPQQARKSNPLMNRPSFRSIKPLPGQTP